MDSSRVNEKAETYRARTLRLTPALFEQLGIVKKNTQLRIEEFSVSCIPFDLSLTKASLLAILNEKEAEFFRKLSGKAQKLFLTWNSPYGTKPETFYLICRISAFRKPGPSSPYCFIDLVFAEPPLSYKEMLVEYFSEADEAEKFYAAAPDAAFSAEQLSSALGSDHLSLIKEGCQADSLKIFYLSPKRMKLYGEFEGAVPVKGEILEFEPLEGDGGCILKGECSSLEAAPDFPGFAGLDVKILFTPYALGRLRRAVGWNPKTEK